MRLKLLLFHLAIISVFEIQAQDHVKKEVEKLIRYETGIRYKKTPGFVMAIIDNDSTYVMNFGTQGPKIASLLSENYVFELGGLSKVFTSLVVLEMAKYDYLSLDDPLEKYFDVQDEKIAKITISQLLNHSSGLPVLLEFVSGSQKNMGQAYENYTDEQILSFLTKDSIELLEKPQYSHLNYVLLGMIIEQASTVSFEEALQVFLWDHFADEGLSLSPTPQLAIGHDKARRKAQNLQLKTNGASLGVMADLKSLVHFMRWQLGITENSDFEYNSLIHEPQTRMKKELPFYHSATWYIYDVKNGYDILSHSGRSNGHYAYIGFVRETKTAVIILANSSHGTEDLGMLTLRMINDYWERKK